MIIAPRPGLQALPNQQYCAQVELRVLGPVTAEHDGRRIPLRGSRERSVLGVLALAAGRRVAVDRLIELLWADEPPARARAAIHTYVSRVRYALAAYGTQGERLLVRDGNGYLMTVDPGAVDAHQFQALFDRARATIDPAARSGLLGEAMALWQGPAFANIEPPAVRERLAGQLNQLRLSAARLRFETELTRGRHEQIIDELAALHAEVPFDEAVAEQWMLALYRSGRRSEALEVYRRTRAVLAAELGLEPGDRLCRLEAAMLRADPGLDPPVAARHEGSRDVPAQLPAPIADFVGRTDELGILDRLLTTDALLSAGPEPGTRTIVVSAIAGTGGIGKTALAVHWAHRVAHLFPDGQLFVNLRGWADGPPLRPIEALSGFLRALGVPNRQIPLQLDEAAALFRSKIANRHILIILDNAPDAETVRPLLAATPGCLVVVTSRDRMVGLTATHGARRLSLDTLTCEESIDLLGAMIGQPRLAADQQGAAELADICGRLPLALRIAAANLLDQPATKIGAFAEAAVASGRVAALTVENDPPASLWSAVRLSYERLPVDGRRLFRWLALVPAVDLTADGAAAISACAVDATRKTLQQLADVCLLDEHRPGRYVMHDLVRDCAAELSQREDSTSSRAAARDRWYVWYLHMAHAANPMVYPTYEPLALPPRFAELNDRQFDDAEQAKSWLEAELPNLVAAVRHAADYGLRRETWLLAHALRGYMWLSRNIVDWDSTARAGLAAAQAEQDPEGQAAMHLSLGGLHATQDSHDPAIAHLQQAADLSRQARWRVGYAIASSNLGMIYWQAGQLERATSHLEQGLAIYRRLGRRAGESAVLTKLGTVHSAAGRLTQAADAYKLALAIDAETGSQVALAHNSNNLGNAYHALGRLEAALSMLRTALRLARENGDRGLEASALDSLAATLCTSGRLDQAKQHAIRSLNLARVTGDRWTEAHALNTLATIYHRSGQHRDAVDGHQRALELATETGSGAAKVAALIGLAEALAANDQPMPALEYAKRALENARTSGYSVLEGRAHTALARNHLALGNATLATEHAERAIEIHRSSRHRFAEADALQVLGLAAASAGNGDAASLHRARAESIYAEVGVHRDPGQPTAGA